MRRGCSRAVARAAGRLARSMCFRPTRMRSTTCGASASLPVNVDPLEREARPIRWSVRVWRACSSATLGDAGGLRAADRAPDRGRAVAERPLVPARRALLPDPGRFADRLSPAARFAALGRARRLIRTCYPPDPTQQLRGARAPRAFAGADRERRPRRAARRGGRRAADCTRASSRRPAIVRTSMCAEERGGVLYVFMPPTRTLEDYLELVAAVEASARRRSANRSSSRATSRPRIRAWSISRSRRIPGVIEVNVQPSASWDELVDAHHASCTRPRSELQAALGEIHDRRPARRHRRRQSHRARRRDARRTRRSCGARICCAACISYWHNHPSLSYLFSGLFIGPTSQAPRVDEARNDSLYELEIAFEQFPAAGRRRRRPGSSTGCCAIC